MGCLPVGRAVSGWSGDLETLAAGRYEGPVRAALLHYKERGRRDLAKPLGELLSRAVTGVLDAQVGTGADYAAGRTAAPGCQRSAPLRAAPVPSRPRALPLPHAAAITSPGWLVGR